MARAACDGACARWNNINFHFSPCYACVRCAYNFYFIHFSDFQMEIYKHKNEQHCTKHRRSFNSPPVLPDIYSFESMNKKRYSEFGKETPTRICLFGTSPYCLVNRLKEGKNLPKNLTHCVTFNLCSFFPRFAILACTRTCFDSSYSPFIHRQPQRQKKMKNENCEKNRKNKRVSPKQMKIIRI